MRPRLPRPRALLLAAAAAILAACRDRQLAPQTAFDGAAAYALVKTQLDFGARVPGTPAHVRAGDWLEAQLRATADTVVVQRWTHVTVKGDTLPLRNILARYHPELTDRVLYVSHWDSRPTSDEATNPQQKALPVPGADDGASSTALLIGVGQALKKTPPNVGVDLLFVDGEDYGDFTENKDVLLGSRYFAANPPAPGYQPLFGVLWDMIGDRDLRIPREENSVRAAPEVVDRVWGVAEELGYGSVFVPEVGAYPVTDDHIPLIEKGMHVIDVIDLDYPYHHTPDDTLDKVSQRSLQIVGDVAVKLVTGG